MAKIGPGTPAERARELVKKHGLAEAQRRAYASKGSDRYRNGLLQALRDIEAGGESKPSSGFIGDGSMPALDDFKPW